MPASNTHKSAPQTMIRTDIAVVGAGIAGLAIAREMQSRGRAVLLLDKGWHPGGRFASRSLGNGDALVDHGVLRFELPGTHRWWSSESIRRVRSVDEGGEAMLGEPARRFVQKLADGLDIRSQHRVSRVQRTPDGEWQLIADDNRPPCIARTVILACPGPQAAELLGACGLARPDAFTLQYQSRWVVTGSVPSDARIRVGDLMASIDGIERGPSVQAGERQGLHLQANAAWSSERIDWTEEQVVEAAGQALQAAGASDLQELRAKRWRYAVAEEHSQAINVQRASGLFVAGDWTQPGPANRGVDRALASAAQMISLLIAGVA